MMELRRAGEADIATLVDMSRRVQDALTAAGSLQVFGPLAPPVVAAAVAASAAYVLCDGACVLGGVFVAPVTSRDHKVLTRWAMDDSRRPIWFLEKLMIEPAKQGSGLGDIILAEVKQLAALHPAHPTIVLDCWAGNARLRTFYERNGFRLHGVFAVCDFEVAVFIWSKGKSSRCHESYQTSAQGK